MIGDALESSIAALVVDPGEAWALYEECLPRRGAGGLSFDPSYTLTSVLDALITHGQRKPLLRFAENIYGRLDDTAKAALDNRLKDVVADWKSLTIAPQNQPQSTSANADSYAIIQFIPFPEEETPDTETKYQVLASLVLRGKRRRSTLFHAFDVSRENINEIVNQIHQAINAGRRTVPRDHICLEFFLPDELLTARLDQCPVKATGQTAAPIPLGQLSPLVFRWNKRAVNRELRDDLSALKHRFHLLTTHGIFSSPIPPYKPAAELGACAWAERVNEG